MIFQNRGLLNPWSSRAARRARACAELEAGGGMNITLADLRAAGLLLPPERSATGRRILRLPPRPMPTPLPHLELEGRGILVRGRRGKLLCYCHAGDAWVGTSPRAFD